MSIFVSMPRVICARATLGILMCTLLVMGCGSSKDATPLVQPPDLPLPRLWEAPLIEPPRAAFIQRVPELTQVSTWADEVSYQQGPERKTSGMPYLGTGNGSVCCLLGTTRPLCTIHGLLGPTYQKGDLQAFFPDIAWTIESAGESVSFQDETIWRVRGTAVVLTRARSPGLEMWTVTWAPFPEAWPGDARPDNQSLFRIVYLRNMSSEITDDLGVRVQLAVGGEVSEGTLTVASEARRLRIIPLDLEGSPSGRALIVPVRLAPGEERGMAFALTTSSTVYPEGPAIEGLDGLSLRSVELRLVDTIRAWRRWYEQGACLETPDPRVNDLVEGLIITDKVSTTIAGGPVEISHYSLVWNRDTYGPMRLFATTGRDREARGILDYHFLAVCHKGGLANAYEADLDPVTAPPALSAEQWASKGTFSGRIAAEGPSLLVLDYYLYLLLRGTFSDFEASDLAARMDMLRSCLYQQAISEEGLLPFSGDETFRPQMAISFGLGIEYPFEEKSWSFNSGVLLVAAAEALARLEEETAKVLGNEDGADRARKARDLGERIRETTRQHFWNASGGYFEPYLMKPDNSPAGAPYGDVDAVPFWAGVDFEGVDKESAAGVLAERLLSRQGVFFSPADPVLHLLLKGLIGEGIYTGMTPGLTLWTLASVFHPDAEDAFNAMDDHADPGGNYPEVVVHDDTSPLTPIYDTSGLLGEMWARYRSWEDGINAEAIFYFLSGFTEDAARSYISLAPMLPNGWPYLRIRGLRLGEAGLDLHVERINRRCMRIAVNHHGVQPVTARVSIPGPALRFASLNGKGLGQGTRVGLIWGGTATELGEVALLPGNNDLIVEYAGELP